MNFEERIMRLALSLAKKGRTSPNPKVGAIIFKNGKIIGKGYHKKAGLAHAEIEAIKSVKNINDLNGSTLYVTLEPCSHLDKRTPPCTMAIIESGIKKVVCAMKDPNPKVNGTKDLKASGVKVETGILEKEAGELNNAYVKLMKVGLPYITMKIAMSFDGKITTNIGSNQIISGPESIEFAHKLRNENSAIMVGIGTILKDDPQLTCRIKGGVNPVRIIVDSKLRIPLNAKVLQNAKDMVIIGCAKVYENENQFERIGIAPSFKTSQNTTHFVNKQKKEDLEKLGVRVVIADEKKVNLVEFLRQVAKLGINSILLEGGSELNASMIKENLVDKFLFIIAPLIIGGDIKGPVGGEGIKEIAEAYKLEFRKIKIIGKDILIEAYPIE